MSPTADRFREDYDPEPDYERPTKAELEAELLLPGPRRAPAVIVTSPVEPRDCTNNTQLADRLRHAADRVAGRRPDLAALLEVAAERLDGGPF